MNLNELNAQLAADPKVLQFQLFDVRGMWLKDGPRNPGGGKQKIVDNVCHGRALIYDKIGNMADIEQPTIDEAVKAARATLGI